MTPRFAGVLALLSLLPHLVSSKTAAQLCKGTSMRADDGNWYCSQVKAITYKNISQPGEYKRTTRVNPKTGLCEHETVAYSGVTPMTPLIGELSMHLRGPMNVSKLAVYKLPDMTISKRSSTRRASNERLRKPPEAIHKGTENTHAVASPMLEKRWMCKSTPTVTVTVQVPATTCSMHQTIPAVAPAPYPPPVVLLPPPPPPPVLITVHDTTTFCPESSTHSATEATSVPPCSSLHSDSSCSCQSTLDTGISSVDTAFSSASPSLDLPSIPFPTSSLKSSPRVTAPTSLTLDQTSSALPPSFSSTSKIPALPSSYRTSTNATPPSSSIRRLSSATPSSSYRPSTSATPSPSSAQRLSSLPPTPSSLWRLTSLTPTPSSSSSLTSPAPKSSQLSPSTGGWVITRLHPTKQDEGQPESSPTETLAVPGPLAPLKPVGNIKRAETSDDVGKAEPLDNVEKAAPATWERVAYYTSAAPAAATGFAFLANLGDPQKSGTFDYSFGNSLGYVIGDGSKVATTNTAFDGTLATSEREIAVFTDKGCDGHCEYSRPDTIAHYGWAGPSKAFFIEFQMDHYDNNGNDQGMLSDAPAWWFLNAAIPRILQYGNDRENIPCSCWSTGCGEFDAFEVLGRGEMRAKSTIHRQGNLEGGDSNYFLRPVGRMIKFVVVFHDWNITARVLDDEFNFDEGVTAAQIEDILRYDSADSEHSLFAIGD